MRYEKKLWCLAAAASCLASGALVHAYKYDGGPNYVNMSGSRCRAATPALGDNLTHDAGRVKVNSGTSTRRLYCPLQRRNTTTYQKMTGTNIATKVYFESLYLRGTDNSSTRSLSCFGFASAIGSGSTLFTGTKYFCSTSGGCGTAPSASFTGGNGLQFGLMFNSVQSVSWGYACDVPGNSSIYFADAAIVSN
jgi:hypothetical protein